MFVLADSADLVVAKPDARTIWARDLDGDFSLADQAGLLWGLLFLWSAEFRPWFLGGEGWRKVVGMAVGFGPLLVVGPGVGESRSIARFFCCGEFCVVDDRGYDGLVPAVFEQGTSWCSIRV